MNDDASIFPEPRNFDPQRWMGPERDIRQKFLLNFGRGTRQCVGMNLAEAEIHVALATVFRKLGRRLELYNTERERDVDVKHDFFVTNPSLDSRGVRVMLIWRTIIDSRTKSNHQINFLNLGGLCA